MKQSKASAPWLVIAGIVCLTIVALRLEGQRWWCACGEHFLWVSDVWTRHCSRHLADAYSLAHVSHGLIFFSVLMLLRPTWSIAWRLCISIGLAAGWEVLENSPFVINRYRHHTMSVEYLGDAVANSMGDICACVLGFLVAWRLGIVVAAAIFITLELVLLLLIRDNLTLDTLMLIHPVESIKAWQIAGRGG